VAGITGATVGGVVGEVVAKKLTNVVISKAAKLAASTIAGAVAGALAGVAIDVIIGSILGAVERDQLESALQALQTQVEEFIPASEEYTDNILEVMAQVKIWDKYHPNN
jgi:membrane protein YqaA with SNARE-associated domain